MKQLIHTGIYLNNLADKNRILNQIMQNRFLIDYIDFESLKGELFSTITIDKLIEEEYRHDRIVIKSAENENLSNMSSGQQKKALLGYLISKHPDFLVLDDVYSNVDRETQLQITKSIQQISEETLIIQVFFRKNDILPCVKQVIYVDSNGKINNLEKSDDFKVDKSSKNQKNDKFILPAYFEIKNNFIDPLIEMSSVLISYGDRPILNNINWTICSGEFWQLTGPNGSGKSTLIGMICGDNPKAYGQNIKLFGRKKGTGETIWEIKQNIGYFTPNMMTHFKRNDSVENMIISGLTDSVGLYVKPTDLQIDMAREWIKMLGSSFEGKMFQQLTIGQQRMVMVARAMIKHPPLLILDEPTIELDDENSQLFIEMVNAIASEKKIAIIYVSHREEVDLQPDLVYELIKTERGYTGKSLK